MLKLTSIFKTFKTKDKKINREYNPVDSNDIYNIITQLKTQDNIIIKQQKIEQQIMQNDKILADMQNDLHQLSLHEKQQKSIVDFIKNHLETLSDRSIKHDKNIGELFDKNEENNKQLQDLTEILINKNINDKTVKNKKEPIIMSVAISVPFVLSALALIITIIK